MNNAWSGYEISPGPELPLAREYRFTDAYRKQQSEFWTQH